MKLRQVPKRGQSHNTWLKGQLDGIWDDRRSLIDSISRSFSRLTPDLQAHYPRTIIG
jgi:hypothetical protein